jgi:hypothetical protein
VKPQQGGFYAGEESRRTIRTPLDHCGGLGCHGAVARDLCIKESCLFLRLLHGYPQAFTRNDLSTTLRP